jgi:carbon monoxide dehydrogenase subunit G
MHFTRQLSTSQSTDQVYDLIADPMKFGYLFPDCQGVEVGATCCFTVTIAVGSGQLSSKLSFQLDRLEAQRPNRLRYLGNGEAAKSIISFELTFDIAPNGSGTHVNCYCFVEVTGPAMFLIQEMASTMDAKTLDQMIVNLERSLASQ